MEASRTHGHDRDFLHCASRGVSASCSRNRRQQAPDTSDHKRPLGMDVECPNELERLACPTFQRIRATANSMKYSSTEVRLACIACWSR